MKEPIRVLQIIGIVAGGGVESVIMNYYENVDRSKVQFDFIVHDDNKIDITQKVEAMGGKVYKVTPYYKNPIAFTYEIYKVIKKFHYRIVHSNMNTLSAFSLFAAWAAGVPIRILHNHSTSSPGETKRNIMKFILRPLARLFANHYLACSRFAGDWMYGQKMMDSGKVTVINNAIDLKKYAFNLQKRKVLRKKLGVADEFVVGHVGRFMYQKNHDFLIDIFAEVHRKIPQMVLLLIGDGPLREGIEEKVRGLNLIENVRFLGVRDDVQDLYNAMDLFILPSHYEGLGMVGVEAQANGLNVLASTAVPDEMKFTNLVQFEDLKNDTSKWSDRIIRIYYNYHMTRNNRGAPIFNQSKFDISVQAKKLVNYYIQLDRSV
uniref:glycosyltransferase family 1 protein n=1 Tax=uncultured Allisonella sp. TaxID=339338 RepID=UPI002804A316|nr:glycosyltransferase family 1 protein [uncultured Allisonella sp.]